MINIEDQNLDPEIKHMFDVNSQLYLLTYKQNNLKKYIGLLKNKYGAEIESVENIKKKTLDLFTEAWNIRKVLETKFEKYDFIKGYKKLYHLVTNEFIKYIKNDKDKRNFHQLGIYVMNDIYDARMFQDIISVNHVEILELVKSAVKFNSVRAVNVVNREYAKASSDKLVNDAIEAEYFIDNKLLKNSNKLDYESNNIKNVEFEYIKQENDYFESLRKLNDSVHKEVLSINKYRYIYNLLLAEY